MSEHSKLMFEERQELWKLREQKRSVNEIAKHLGRAVSTVTREMEKNRHPVAAKWAAMSAAEKARYAHNAAKRRASEARERRRLKSEELREYVLKKLTNEHWSPEAISERLKLEYPNRPEMRISAKSIYNFIKYDRYDQKELEKYLRRRGKPYRQRVSHRRGKIRQGAPAKRSIDLRSTAINERLEYGHWEIDTIHSCRKGSQAILSLRERKSRQPFFFKIPNLQAQSVVAVLRPFFRDLPAAMRKSLTSDNGPEFASSDLLVLEDLFEGFTVYYCHPFCACERGGVENSNGDFRWYFAKGTDFANVSIEQVKEAQHKLSDKPMKLHQYKTPNEVFTKACLAMREAEKAAA